MELTPRASADQEKIIGEREKGETETNVDDDSGRPDSTVRAVSLIARRWVRACANRSACGHERPTEGMSSSSLLVSPALRLYLLVPRSAVAEPATLESIKRVLRAR